MEAPVADRNDGVLEEGALCERHAGAVVVLCHPLHVLWSVGAFVSVIFLRVLLPGGFRAEVRSDQVSLLARAEDVGSSVI